ncbi:amidohydrolase, imidazolonepropionase [Frankia casuarinae]|uniref:Amidohydrolase 3 n=1 Tax=Frankia casuarinae (strain DSM 45818 / CECT 9043 / HFP020203 / CcI3) TaxID=106370 RepID=Q2J7C6_FRACC|nr:MULTISPECIES: amidohydrolase family protein [Frankia]ABD12816.1 Amidohydrolase 3 [Frankia casuarinae]ETA03268.1 amidohydrolase, imidazolonepropionase [Frankia sp. CcI6]EYT92660.1 amidohydrolase, imidazolonepropionase [Frankia casuarinae]KFB05060.1 amidohydrolase, imidazolonepropionase [Frankia sp. Allo2]OFB44167.1 amidohydrolase [Frankia sp. CgIM4]
MNVPALRIRGGVLVSPTEVRDEVWVVDGRITFSAPTGPAARDVRTVSGWVLPGLVDAHCHVGLAAHGAVDRPTAEQQIITDRAAGALLLRDAGSPADTRWIDARDDLPRLVRAGRHIARPRRYLRNYAAEVEPADLVAEVLAQAGRGDGWVKLVGDWIDRGLGDLAPCWPADVAKAAIDAAHAAGARVTAHCFAEDSLADLVEAGIDCIEHATGLTERTIPLFAERGVAIVPTLVNIATFEDIAAGAEAKFPAYARHMRALYARRHDTVRAAYDAGIPIFVGTDAGGSLPHGLVAAEVAELRLAGLPAAAALDAATWGARSWLGYPGLSEGAWADLVVYPSDPRADVAVLGAPDLIVLRGRPVSA